MTASLGAILQASSSEYEHWPDLRRGVKAALLERYRDAYDPTATDRTTLAGRGDHPTAPTGELIPWLYLPGAAL